MAHRAWSPLGDELRARKSIKFTSQGVFSKRNLACDLLEHQLPNKPPSLFLLQLFSAPSVENSCLLLSTGNSLYVNFFPYIKSTSAMVPAKEQKAAQTQSTKIIKLIFQVEKNTWRFFGGGGLEPGASGSWGRGEVSVGSNAIESTLQRHFLQKD